MRLTQYVQELCLLMQHAQCHTVNAAKFCVCRPHLVSLPNVELHDALLGLVEHRGGHRQALAPVILLPKEPSKLLEGTGLIRFCWVNVATLRLLWVIQLHFSHQERVIPEAMHIT